MQVLFYCHHPRLACHSYTYRDASTQYDEKVTREYWDAQGENWTQLGLFHGLGSTWIYLG